VAGCPSSRDGAEPSTTAPTAADPEAASAKPRNRLPALEPARLKQAEKALVRVVAEKDPDVRLRMAAQAFAELEEGRLPKGISGVYDAVSFQSVDAAQRTTFFYRALSEDLLPGWKQACDPADSKTDPERLLERVSNSTADRRTKMRLVYGGCRLDRLGLVKATELTSAHGAVAAGHATWAHLEALGGASPVERRLLVELMRAGAPFDKPIGSDELADVP